MSDHAGPIVVPLDGSTNAEAAVPSAVRLGRCLGAPLRFVRVDADWDRVSDDQRTGSRSAFEGYAGGLVRLYGGQHQSWSAVVLGGAPADAIVEEATHARMIVLASHGEGGLKAFFSGSVADRVVRAATVPVLVVPTDGAHGVSKGPVLVAVDGSEAAEAALAVGREVGAATGQPLVLLQAWNPVVASAGEFAAPTAAVVTELANAADDYLAAIRAPGEEAVAVAGPPGSAIRDAAERLDVSMVVVASHGKGRAMRLALGSTTETLRRSLHRPLLVVPAAARRARDDLAAAVAAS